MGGASEEWICLLSVRYLATLLADEWIESLAIYLRYIGDRRFKTIGRRKRKFGPPRKFVNLKSIINRSELLRSQRSDSIRRVRDFVETVDPEHNFDTQTCSLRTIVRIQWLGNTRIYLMSSKADFNRRSRSLGGL